MAGLPFSSSSTTNPPAPPPLGLVKQRSWSPDSEREEIWLRRKGLHRSRRGEAASGGPGHTRLRRSVTDEDLDELRACIDLGFGFDIDFAVPEVGGGVEAVSREDDLGRRRLSETFPALDLYYAVHRSYRDSIAGSSPSTPRTAASFDDESSPAESPVSFFSPGESPEKTKARLKQWAQVVACSVRQRC